MRQLEIGGSSDFSQEFLYDQLHPKKQAFVQKFARPKRPGTDAKSLTDDDIILLCSGKGGSRLTTTGSSSALKDDGDEAE